MLKNKFPPPEMANEEGLLAIGGDLEMETLIEAYSQGIFPWPISPSFPLAWFSPEPRGILEYRNLHISKSLLKLIKQQKYEIRFNQNFEGVILQCASTPRKGQDGTWITQEIINSYIAMFRQKFAYSVEAYQDDQLVGGIYGVCLKGNVSGESMFCIESNVSKVCLVALMERLQASGIGFLDTQMVTSVVESMGGTEISREDFLQRLRNSNKQLSRIDIFGN